MIKITGIPYDENSSFLKGAAGAPQTIRLMEKKGSSNSFSESGIEIADGKSIGDYGDIMFTPGTNQQNAFSIIKNHISGLIADNSKLVSLGGDHSVTFPIISAFAEKYTEINLLHFDAHPDLYENFENNYFSHASPVARIFENNLIKSLTQVGIRTLNLHQQQQIERYNVKVVDMKKFNFDFINDLKSPLYISIDLDVLDPAFAPGISHHEPGGISTRDLIHIIQNIKAEIIGADIVEYNPTRDINHMTAMVAYKLLKEVVSQIIVNSKNN